MSLQIKPPCMYVRGGGEGTVDNMHSFSAAFLLRCFRWYLFQFARNRKVGREDNFQYNCASYL